MKNSSSLTQNASETEDLKKMLEKIQKEFQAFEQEGQRILEKTGMSKKEMDLYVNNPNNFSKSEWEILEKAKNDVKKFQEDIVTALGKRTKEEPAVSKEKKQKSKSLTPKKKNWIPIP